MGINGMNLDKLLNVEFPVPQVTWPRLIIDTTYEEE